MCKFISKKTIVPALCLFFAYWLLCLGYGYGYIQVGNYQPEVIDDYRVLRVHGKRLVQELISPLSHQVVSQEYQHSTYAHLYAIIAMIHYFGALAHAKHQEFCEGTFIIEDYSGKIYHFLRSYAGTYRRISSHFGEYCVQQYGLDIPVHCRSHILFPCHKRHLLFAQLDQHTLFIKPENYGTNVAIPSDVIMHSKEYVQYVIRNLIRKGPERFNWREERIPSNIVHSWHHFLLHWMEDTHHISPLVYASKKYGIKSIVAHLPAIQQRVPEPTVVQNAAYKRLLQALDHYDHCHMRRGSEVILRVSELLNGVDI